MIACAFCGAKIKFKEVFLGRVLKLERKKWAHDYCWIREKVQMDTYLSMWCVLDDREKRIAELELLIDSLKRMLDSINADLIDTMEYGKTSTEEAKKILYWLEMNGARKAEGQYMGIFDPVLVEILTKVSGMELQEIINEVKNKELKRYLNKMKDEQGGKGRGGKVRKK